MRFMKLVSPFYVLEKTMVKSNALEREY